MIKIILKGSNQANRNKRSVTTYSKLTNMISILFISTEKIRLICLNR
nr:MAG TPA: hypothetical protein [Caudoviricetes sp.]